MAKTNTVQIKLVSSADTGFFYVTKKNPRTKTDKLELKKYDPVARKHVAFKEAKSSSSAVAAGSLDPIRKQPAAGIVGGTDVLERRPGCARHAWRRKAPRRRAAAASRRCRPASAIATPTLMVMAGARRPCGCRTARRRRMAQPLGHHHGRLRRFPASPRRIPRRRARDQIEAADAAQGAGRQLAQHVVAPGMPVSVVDALK